VSVQEFVNRGDMSSSNEATSTIVYFSALHLSSTTLPFHKILLRDCISLTLLLDYTTYNPLFHLFTLIGNMRERNVEKHHKMKHNFIYFAPNIL